MDNKIIITIQTKQIHYVSNIFQIQPKIIKNSLYIVTWLSFIQTLCQYLKKMKGFGQTRGTVQWHNLGGVSETWNKITVIN